MNTDTMNGFRLKTQDGTVVRFRYYTHATPATLVAFDAALPFSRTFMHARVSGQEIWTDDAPAIDVPQENATVFTEPGEVVIGPLNPARVKTAKCMGIYYGEGRGLDACNVFAKVLEEDFHLLKTLGESIWKNGIQELYFERMKY